jgi:hypothetical protein
MTRITYEIVEHDGGWAYKVGDVFSEPFPLHDAVRRAAERVPHDQVLPRVDGHFIRGQGWPLARRTVGRFRSAGDGCRGLKGEPTVVAAAPLLLGGPTYVGGYYTFPNVVLRVSHCGSPIGRNWPEAEGLLQSQ